ncbi:hypothetical protein [Riemerella anatipestifer]|uniref:hypothetical protein n=1 Tax=Riemerella anatipestifer TaxID=34085 RepID=UPI00129E0721|nr:hypothetical protein [Riemerella anatipestifer]
MKAKILTPEKELLKKFNEITGRRFRETKANLSGISARLKAGNNRGYPSKNIRMEEQPHDERPPKPCYDFSPIKL